MCVKKKDKNNACIEKEVGACDLKFPHGLKRSKVKEKKWWGVGVEVGVIELTRKSEISSRVFMI